MNFIFSEEKTLDEALKKYDLDYNKLLTFVSEDIELSRQQLRLLEEAKKWLLGCNGNLTSFFSGGNSKKHAQALIARLEHVQKDLKDEEDDQNVELNHYPDEMVSINHLIESTKAAANALKKTS